MYIKILLPILEKYQCGCVFVIHEAITTVFIRFDREIGEFLNICRSGFPLTFFGTISGEASARACQGDSTQSCRSIRNKEKPARQAKHHLKHPTLSLPVFSKSHQKVVVVDPKDARFPRNYLGSTIPVLETNPDRTTFDLFLEAPEMQL